MALKWRASIIFSILSIMLVSSTITAYAEVQSLQFDKTTYFKGDTLTVSGTTDEDATGLVTVVIRDPNEKFVLLTQAMIQADNTFERDVSIGDKFTIHGVYNATAFLQNMTAGQSKQFGVSTNGSPISPPVSEPIVQVVPITSEPEPVVSTQTNVEPKKTIASFVDPTINPQYYVDRYNNEPAYKDWFDRNYPDVTIEDAVGIVIEPVEPIDLVNTIPGFPDPAVDPQHYIDRYNNEPAYKDWFDRNFPTQTIFEVVGISEIDEKNSDIQNNTLTNEELAIQETSPIAVQSSVVSSTSNELSQMLLALGGLGVLFGAVYGIKRKVDTNTEQIAKNRTVLEHKVNKNSDQISQNRFWLKKKILSLKTSSELINRIKDRLAKGEITVDEYYKLLRALKK